MTEKIFFDTDCLSAFLHTGHQNLLVELFSGRIVIPTVVQRELSYVHILKQRINVMIDNHEAELMDLEVGTEEYDNYNDMISHPKCGLKLIGKGEAACIALARKYNGSIASNNYRDITDYIQVYKIENYDIGGILVLAYKKQFIAEEEGNVIWQEMKHKNRKLMTDTFSQYLQGVN